MISMLLCHLRQIQNPAPTSLWLGSTPCGSWLGDLLMSSAGSRYVPEPPGEGDDGLKPPDGDRFKDTEVWTLWVDGLVGVEGLGD